MTQNRDVVEIANYRIGVDKETPEGLFSAGIHPYDAALCQVKWIEELHSIALNNSCIAIGECGLDSRVEDIERQTEILKEHILLAKKLQKPLIIHTVRSQNEILKLTKELDTPIILHSYHNFDKNIKDRKNIYLSLSYRNIIQSKPIDLDRLLFESDDSTEYTIKEVYTRYSEVHGIALEDLKRGVEQNFKTIFLKQKYE